jgi:hypothetical protein
MLADARKVQHFDSKLGSRMDARRIDPRCCDSWPARIASFTLQQPFYQRISYSPTDDNSSNRMGLMEKIKEIEAEMARTQKNKATNYHLGTLKAKLAKLRNDLLIEQGGGGGGGREF